MIKLIPLKADRIITKDDNLSDCINNSLKYNNEPLNDKDILVICETVCGTVEGRQWDLREVNPSNEALSLSDKYSLDPRLTQLIIDESEHILGGLLGVLLTVNHDCLIANAGIDLSNAGGESMCVLWPAKPYETAERIRSELISYYSLNELGVIISDSHIQPLRQGVIGSAIGVAGFKPVDDCIGRSDLFGHVMTYTKRAVADMIVTGAHLLMGECDERTPFVICRGARIEYTNEKISPNETYMPFKECLFMNSLNGRSDYSLIN